MRQVLFLIILFSSGLSFSQSISPQERLRKQNSFKQLDFEKLSIQVDDFFLRQNQRLGLEKSTMRLVSKREGLNDEEYHRYQQLHEGKKIIGANYILRTKNQIVQKARGIIVPDLEIDMTPRLDSNLALAICKDYLLNEKYDPQSLPHFGNIDWEIKENELVIIDGSFPTRSGNYILAYHIRLAYDDFKPIDQSLFLNASTGEVLSSYPHIHSAPIEGEHETFYYGKQNLTVDSIGTSEYIMLDPTRNDMQVIDASDSQIVSNTSNNFDSDNANVPYIASDAHYCTAHYHDYMEEQFNWKGVDGFGGALLTRINQGGKYYTNAFWNGTYAAFGNGNCDSYNPLTILDVVAHEYAHGFVDYTSDLIYRNESGALNEATADIIGKTVEYKADPQNFSWYVGARAAKHTGITGFRSMINPVEKNDPKYYGGQHWYTGRGDNGGVHSNSGVLNFWYYLLVEGQTGVNENDVSYDVQAIGYDDAMAILYSAHLGNLTENSNYFDTYYATIDQSINLFGENSFQHINVVEAWKAVGIFEGIDNYDLSIEPVLEDIPYCPGDQQIASVIIRNVGLLSFKSGEIIDLNYTFLSSAYDETIILNNDLVAGDSIVYELQKAIEDVMNPTERIILSVSHPADINTVNNNSTINIRSSETNGIDIKLNGFQLSQDDVCGIPEINGYSYTIQNKGCTTLNTGDSLYFHLDTGDEIITFRRALFFDFEPNVYQGSYSPIDPPLIGDFKNFNVSLEFSGDLNESNNHDEGEISYTQIIENGYFESFTPEVEDQYFYTESNLYYGVDSIVEYQGDYVLAFTGQRQSASYVDCSEIEDFFDSYYYRSVLRYCVDTEGMDEPIFSFDLTQLYNDEFFQNIANLDHRSIVQIVTDSISSEHFYAQDEGKSINRQLKLTKDYVGPLEVRIITLSGEANPFFEGDITRSDAAIIDNVRLFDQTEEDIKFGNENYIVFPNPSSDFITIQSKSTSDQFDILIFDELGRIVKESSKEQFISTLDVSNLPSGVYFLNVLIGSETTFQKKVVVTH